MDDRHHPTCATYQTTRCTVQCNSPSLMSFIQKPVASDSGAYQLALLFGLMLGAWAAQAITVSLADSICFNLLGLPRPIAKWLFLFFKHGSSQSSKRSS